MLDILEITDAAAIVCVHTGSYFKVRKRSVGWLFSLIAITYFAYRSANLHLISQSLGHCISFSLAVYGLWKWRKEESGS